MKFKTLVALALAVAPMFVHAQDTSQAVKDADRTLYKIQQLSMIKFITPLLLKKAQINDILTTMEKCKAKEMEIRELDAKELKKLESRIDKAIADAINDGGYPNKEFQAEIIKTQDALIIRRRIATGEMVDMMYETCKKTLNSGQMNVMKNLMDPKLVDPSFKVEKMTDEEKIKTYIRQIFLDAISYDVLKQLAKHAGE